MKIVDPLKSRVLSVKPRSVCLLPSTTVRHSVSGDSTGLAIISVRTHTRQQRSTQHVRIVNRTLPKGDVAEAGAAVCFFSRQSFYPLRRAGRNIQIGGITEHFVRF